MTHGCLAVVRSRGNGGVVCPDSFQGTRGDPGDAGSRGEPGLQGPKVRVWVCVWVFTCVYVYVCVCVFTYLKLC